MPDVVFVHGWGFDASVWDEVCTHLPDRSLHFVDLGFFAKPHMDLTPNAVYVTHSMGLAWVLKHVPDIAGLVSINGFTRFCADETWPHGVPEKMLNRMIRQFQKQPDAVWVEFMKNAGMAVPHLNDNAHKVALLKGLEDLKTWDVRQAYQALEVPKMAIASHNDQIVEQKLSKDSFGEDVIWYKEGTHLLPLSQAKSLAQHIHKFMDQFS